MKKIIDKKIVAILVIMFILGFLGGILFLIMTNKLDKLIIKEEMEEYFNLIKTGEFSNFNSFINSFKNNIIYITIILVSSVVFLLSPLVFFINFYKGFVIGFLMSSIVLTFKVKGILYSILSIIPHQIIMIILIIIYSSIMLKFTIKLFKGFRNGENINIRLFTEKVLLMFLGALILALISSLLELYLNTFILNAVL